MKSYDGPQLIDGKHMMDGKARVVLCEAAQVAQDMPLRCEFNGIAYAVFLLGDRYYVISDTCTHGPGSLSEGYIDGCEVECPFHQGRFDIITGAVRATPCTVPVRTWTAHLVDGRIEIDPDEVRPTP